MRARAVGVVALGLLVLAPAAAARPARGVRVAPRPAWVAPLAPDLAAPIPDAQVSAGTYELLVDVQLRAAPASSERWVHVARKVLGPTGIESAAELTVEFDPTYQRLTLHQLAIHRAGRVLDALRPATVRLVQRETDLERRLIDGRLSAVVIVEDLRVGDVLEYAYSIAGVNPVLGGRFASALDLGLEFPVHRLHQRLLWTRERPVQVKVHGDGPAPTVRQVAGGQELVWDRTTPPLVIAEPSVPPWLTIDPWAELTDFASWGEVARWAVPLFRPATSAGALRAIADRIAREHATPPARALAALRFVQDEIRYFGLELGAHSHEPHRPHEVLRRRFGDCKDKTLLLISLLAALGIDGHAAMVDGDRRRGLDEHLPSPFAFDHVIVRVSVGGEIVWVDPTRSLQGGTLATHAPLPFERALVVEPATTSLAVLPTPRLDAPDLVVHEMVDLSAPSGPGEMTVATRYLGARADAMRQVLATRSREELARHWTAFYSQLPFVLEAVGLPEVRDDREANVLTVGERYRIERPARGELELTGHAIVDGLPRRSARRTQPLWVEHPVHVVHTVVLRRAAAIGGSRATIAVAADAATLTGELREDGGDVAARWIYRTLSDTVPPDRADRFWDRMDEMRLQLVFAGRLDGAEVAPVAAAASAGGGLALVLLALALGGAAVAFVAARRRTRRLAPFRAAVRLGETPGAPVPVAALDPIDWERLAPCGCGGRLAPRDAVATAEVRYGDRILHVVRPACRACGRVAPRYLEVQS